MIRAQDKGRCRLLLDDSGVSVPKTLIASKVPTKWVTYPAVIRPKKHHKGQHLFVVENVHDVHAAVKKHKKLLADGWYISEYIKKDKEVRVHCAHGKILFVQDKNYTGEHVQANHNINGESWKVVPWNELDASKAYHAAMVEALKAVEAIGLDFGGVDVMLKKNKAYVCEINTAPTQEEYGGLKYGLYFKWLELGKSHWDFTKFKKAKSLIFKNSQLKEGLDESK